ncbi:hypothetical protein ACFUJU_11955 [Streptomyces sp. NPDC057235]|uniref:hypothetical protein n=1 Tax=Streptomyces sp. NPDC057235 TaxID=3346058 RepID=UPI00363E7C8A
MPWNFLDACFFEYYGRARPTVTGPETPNGGLAGSGRVEGMTVQERAGRRTGAGAWFGRTSENATSPPWWASRPTRTRRPTVGEVARERPNGNGSPVLRQTAPADRSAAHHAPADP